MPPLASTAVLVGLIAAAVLVLRRRVFLVAVVGQSMAPTYRDGERVLAIRTRRVRPGDVVVFTMPSAGLASLPEGSTAPVTVKRVTSADTAGGPVVVAGDAPRSVDSSVFGPVDRDLIIGRVLRPRPRPV